MPGWVTHKEDKTEKSRSCYSFRFRGGSCPGFYRASRLDGGRFGGRTGSEDEAGFWPNPTKRSLFALVPGSGTDL